MEHIFLSGEKDHFGQSFQLGLGTMLKLPQTSFKHVSIVIAIVVVQW